jgi:dUTPase
MFIHLFNYGNSIATLSPGDKIVQFVLLPLGNPYLQEVPESGLHKEVSTRGEGGFGSSGEK